MLERLLENWLDNASERSYQIPFTQILIDDGLTIIHSTRHSQIEFGKDVIAIDQNNKVHAYQLKGIGGKKLSKNELSRLLPQLNELVSAKINHPAITTDAWHQSYLVINGELDEEASTLLTQVNKGYVDGGFSQRQLKVIVRGQLLDGANRLSQRLIPHELREFKLLLELYLKDGKGFITKDIFYELLLRSIPFLFDDNRPSNAEFSRIVTSLALITSIATSSYSNSGNHFAELEAWMIYLCNISAAIEKFSIPHNFWSESYFVIEERFYFLLREIVLELKLNPKATEVDALTDVFVYRSRITLLCALVSIYSLWSRMRNQVDEDLDEFCRHFVLENRNKIELIGEASVPQMICTYWYLKKLDSTPRPDFMIANILQTICLLNQTYSKRTLPNPYYDIETIMLSHCGDPKYKIQDTFNQHAFTVEALMHLFVRQNWKQNVKAIWPNYSKIMTCFVDFDEPWRTYLWRSEGVGRNTSVWPRSTKSWEELKQEADESKGERLPTLLKSKSHLFMLFLIVYPHRCTSEGVRWLDTQLRGI